MTMPNDGREAALREGMKLYFEAMKHVATLASGTILVVVALIKEHIIEGTLSQDALYAIVLLLISIFSSLLSMFVYAGLVQGNGEIETWRIYLGRISWWSTSLSFMAALVIIGICSVTYASKSIQQTQPQQVQPTKVHRTAGSPP